MPLRPTWVPFVLLVAMCVPPAVRAGQGPASSISPDESRTYEAFRAWLSRQPVDVQRGEDDAVYGRYADALRAEGRPASEVEATLALLRRVAERAEIDRWNRILTSPTPRFNTSPNAFLVEMTKGRAPGRSLDVGMGQGRNTIYLAQQGWDSAGFDPAEQAVEAARAEASRLGVRITTSVAKAEDFDWGESKWDLIVLSYVGARDHVARVVRALRPGGMVVVEGYHRDVLRQHPVGGAVVFDSNELPTLFAALRIVRYEDTMAVSDFGLERAPVVRLAAVRP